MIKSNGLSNVLTKFAFLNTAIVVAALLGGQIIHSSPNRLPSPFVSGDGFRAFCKFVIDETNTKMDPRKVMPKDTIFVKPELLNFFFQRYHPNILSPYILVSHNSDNPAPNTFAPYLDEPKIIAWFSANVTIPHPKLHPIPIGFENRYNSNGDPDRLQAIKSSFVQEQHTKTMLLYLNINAGTYPTERTFVENLFRNKSFCTKATRKPYKEFMYDLGHAQFVLSPRGNGLDCHRTWEALYMGSIPVVTSSGIDILFEGLPVLIIENWEQVTEGFLREQYDRLSKGIYTYEKLTLEYWLNIIRKYQK